MTLQWLSRLIHQRNTRPTFTAQAVPVVLVSRELLLLWFHVQDDARLKNFFVVLSVTLSIPMFVQTAQSWLKLLDLSLQLQQ
jgi:hypothetical protein